MCWDVRPPGQHLPGPPDRPDGPARLGHYGVEGDRIHPPYAYTLGLTESRLPELVVTGMALRRVAALLNEVAASMVHADPPAAGDASRW